MASNPGLIPSSTTPVADAQGKITNPWYFWLKSVATNSTSASGTYVIDGSNSTYGQAVIYQGNESGKGAGVTGDIYFAVDSNNIYTNQAGTWNLMIPAFTGDVTSPGGSTVLTLSNTGVAPGVYTNATINVDSDGRILAAGSGTSGGGTSVGGPGTVQFAGTTLGSFDGDGTNFTYSSGQITLGAAVAVGIISTPGSLILNGTSNVIIQTQDSSTGFVFDASGALGIGLTSPSYGTSGQVLTSQGTGVAPIWSAGGSSGALTATYVGYGDGSNVLTGTSDFTWTNGTGVLFMGTNPTISASSTVNISSGAGTSATLSNVFEAGAGTDAIVTIETSNVFSLGTGIYGPYANVLITPAAPTAGNTFTWGNFTIQDSNSTTDFNAAQFQAYSYTGYNPAVGVQVNTFVGGTYHYPTVPFFYVADGFEVYDGSQSFLWYDITTGTALNPFPVHTWTGSSFVYNYNGTQTFSIPPTTGTSGQVLQTDGAGNTSWTTGGGGGGGTPGGSSTDIQYNSSGAFAGSSNFTWTDSTKTLGFSSTANTTISGQYINFTVPTPSDITAAVNFTANVFTWSAAVDGSLCVTNGIGGGYGQNFNLFPPITPNGAGYCHSNMVFQTKPAATGNVTGQTWIQIDTSFNPTTLVEAAAITLGGNTGSSGGQNYSLIPLKLGVVGTNNVFLQFNPTKAAGQGFWFQTDGTTKLSIDDTQVNASVPVVLPTYTLTTLPTSIAGGTIYVSNANSGAGALCYGDGTHWKDAATHAAVV